MPKVELHQVTLSPTLSPGSSVHEYACAMDFAVQVEGVLDWGHRPYYLTCGRIAKEPRAYLGR
jgi:hypothetical protein